MTPGWHSAEIQFTIESDLKTDGRLNGLSVMMVANETTPGEQGNSECDRRTNANASLLRAVVEILVIPVGHHVPPAIPTTSLKEH